MDTASLIDWFEANFKWESTEQHKGFLNLIQYLKSHCPEGADPLLLIASYFIQKDHESNEWWLSLITDQFGRMQQEMMKLRIELHDLKFELTKAEKGSDAQVP